MKASGKLFILLLTLNPLLFGLLLLEEVRIEG
jgi:hypothetical protein